MTRTSTAGKSNNRFLLLKQAAGTGYSFFTTTTLLLNIDQKPFNKDQAFTLIELVVVMSLISLILFFSIPRLDISFFSNNKRKTTVWLLLTVKSLKQNAVEKQTGFILNVDLDKNQMWTSVRQETGATDESVEIPRENEYKLPEGLHLMDVEYNDQEKITTGVAQINFYPKGYSDKAVIHMEDDQNRYSYIIEPFLLNVDVYERYVEL